MSTEAVQGAQGAANPDTTLHADDDPREAIEVGVLMANGRLAGRRFVTLDEAIAWARPQDGERVVEFNVLCECSFTS